MSSQPSPTEEHLALLRQLTASSGHTGGTLYEHLLCTARLLELWGRPHEVCLAGLFHSVYGTQSYSTRSVSLTERSRIRDAIGERAEWLAYVFCVADRRAFFGKLGEPEPRLPDHVHETELSVLHEDLVALIEIELANYVEFMQRISLSPQELEDLRANIETARDHISPSAYQATVAATRTHSPATTGEIQPTSTSGADSDERQQRAPRLSSRLYPSVAGSVHFWCGGREERGLIHDISRTGARIAETTARVQPGEQVELFFLLGANPRRIKAVASVVRRTPTGFAVRFLRIQRELDRLVLAATPETGTR